MKKIILSLWFILVSHRAFMPRTQSVVIENINSKEILIEVITTVLIFLVSCILLFVRLKNPEKPRVMRVESFLILFTVFSTISLLWTPSPIYAGFWLLRLITLVILVTLYFEHANRHDVQKFVMITLFALLPYVALPIISFYQGSIYTVYRATGYWFHPGIASITSFSLVILFSLRALQKGRLVGINLFLALICFFSAFLAGGKTGAFGAVISLFILIIISRRFWLKFRFLVFVLIFIMAILVLRSEFEIGLFEHFKYYKENMYLSTLYDRFDLWLGAVKMWIQNPITAILGLGFTSTRVFGIVAASGIWSTTHAHNSLINLLVETGPFGLILFIAMIFNVLKKVLRNKNILVHSTILPYFGALIVLIIGSMFDTVFGGTLLPPFYLFIALMLSTEQMIDIQNRKNQFYKHRAYVLEKIQHSKL